MKRFVIFEEKLSSLDISENLSGKWVKYEDVEPLQDKLDKIEAWADDYQSCKHCEGFTPCSSNECKCNIIMSSEVIAIIRGET